MLEALCGGREKLVKFMWKTPKMGARKKSRIKNFEIIAFLPRKNEICSRQKEKRTIFMTNCTLSKQGYKF